MKKKKITFFQKKIRRIIKRNERKLSGRRSYFDNTQQRKKSKDPACRITKNTSAMEFF